MKEWPKLKTLHTLWLHGIGLGLVVLKDGIRGLDGVQNLKGGVDFCGAVNRCAYISLLGCICNGKDW